MKVNPFAMLFQAPPAKSEDKTRMRDLSKSEQHEFRKAHGRKGGFTTSKDREFMAALGRAGGIAKARGRHGKS